MDKTTAKKIKVAELFYSLQGEGQYLGTPSIFLRVFGCNFKCAGFSMPRGHLSDERLSVDPSKYTDYNSLPLVHTGCDSYASWDPRFKHLSPMMEIKDIVDKMEELLPNGMFGNDAHLIITGGEPLLGWQKMYAYLLAEIGERDMGLNNITFETNGTQDLNQDFLDFLKANPFFPNLNITFSVSSKLPSSGEKFEEARSAFHPSCLLQVKSLKRLFVLRLFVSIMISVTLLILSGLCRTKMIMKMCYVQLMYTQKVLVRVRWLTFQST